MKRFEGRCRYQKIYSKKKEMGTRGLGTKFLRAGSRGEGKSQNSGDGRRH